MLFRAKEHFEKLAAAYSPNDLHLYVHKVQVAEELKLTDNIKRKEFVESTMEQQQMDAELSSKILFTYILMLR